MNYYKSFIYIVLACFSFFSPAFLWALAIDSVAPNWNELGQTTEVTISGTGFDAATRVSVALDTGNSQKIIGFADTPGSGRSISIVGDIAYVADGYYNDPENGMQSAFQILDISSPTLPFLINTVPLPFGVESGNSLKVVGTIAYVSLDSGMQIIDVADPNNPVFKGVVNLPAQGINKGLDVAGSYVYIADANNDLQVVDVSNLDAPFLTGSYDVPYTEGSYTATVTVSGDIAFLGTTRGCQILDISDPAAPLFISSVSWPSAVTEKLTVIGNTLYATLGNAGFQIIDVSTPASPVTGSLIDTPGQAKYVTVVGSIAYVADGNGGLQIIDIIDPSSPELLGTVKTGDEIHELIIIEDNAFIVDGAGLKVIDITEPNTPNLVGWIDTAGYARDVVINGDMAYVANSYVGLQVVDVSDPGNPMVDAVFPVAGAYDVAIDGSTAYVVSDYVGLKIVDIGTPSDPSEQATVATAGNPKEIIVRDNVAYVADEAGLEIVALDPVTPANSTIVSTYTTNSIGADVAVVGDYAYLIDWLGGDGLHIVNISNSAVPNREGLVPLSGYRYGLAVVNGIAYVANGSSGLTIVNVSNPATAEVLTTLGGLGNVEDVTVVDNIAYVATYEADIHMIDVSVPEEPLLIATIEAPGYLFKLPVVNGLAYGVSATNGIFLVPVPVEVPRDNIGSDSSLAMAVTLPATNLAGHYNIRVFNSSESDELPGAMTFSGDFIPPEPTEPPPVPKTEHKAIIVAGYGPHYTNWLWSETQRNANHAYNTMKWQGYTDENIYYLSNVNVDINGDGVMDVDGDANLANLEYAISNWAEDAYDLVIYLVDHGGTETFQIKRDDTTYEVLQASTMAEWLNNLQETMPGRLLLVYEACYSGSFLEPMKVPDGKDYERVLFSSSAADEKSQFLYDGRLSFSYQFWTVIYESADLTQAFNHGRSMMEDSQTAWLDANGDGTPNTWYDQVANPSFGRGYKSAPGIPYISNVQPGQSIAGTSNASFWAEVQTMNPLTKVWAVIIPPDYDPSAPDTDLVEIQSVELFWSESNQRYEADFTGAVYQGDYAVSYYAMDDKDGISLPRSSTITRSDGPDIYEDDDLQEDANPIVINERQAQIHNIHDTGDIDWVKFYGLAGESYAFEVTVTAPASSEMFAYIELYNKDGVQLDYHVSIGPLQPNEKETLTWSCTQNGIYYVKIYNFAPLSGPTCNYYLRAYHPSLSDFPEFTSIAGTITAGSTPLEDATISAVNLTDPYTGTGITAEGGDYSMELPDGTYDITVQADGYAPKTFTGVEVSADSNISVDMASITVLPGDVDGSGQVSLSDAILTLQVLSGLDPTSPFNLQNDVDGDSKVDLAEAVYVLRDVAGLH